MGQNDVFGYSAGNTALLWHLRMDGLWEYWMGNVNIALGVLTEDIIG